MTRSIAVVLPPDTRFIIRGAVTGLILCLGALVGLFSPPARAADLLHEIRFDKGTVEDSAGKAGVTVSSQPRFVPGRIGQKAILLNGREGYLKFDRLDLGQTFTISEWIKPGLDCGSSLNPILVTGDWSRDSKDASRFYISFNTFHTADGKLMLTAQGVRGARPLVSGSNVIVPGVWSLVTLTVDLRNAPPGIAPQDQVALGTAQLFVNGEAATPPTPVTRGIEQKPQFLAGWIPGTGFGYRGALDDLRIYSGVLGADEIKALANAPTGGDKSPNLAPVRMEPTDQLLATLKRNQHPRIILTPERLERLKRAVATDENEKKWYAMLQTFCVATLKTPPIRSPELGKLDLNGVRVSLDRVSALALMYHLTGEKGWADRAWIELAALAAYPDWNQDNWLATGEACATVAIGYDWLYDAWTDQQRAELRTCMVEKGLKPGLATHTTVTKYSFDQVTFNWNQVCNGGVTMAALAVADDEPKLAGELIRYALLTLPRAFVQFAPDGASVESPAYWDYANLYTAMLLSSMNDSLGKDFGLTTVPGVAAACNFPQYVTGPFGIPFNYNDSGPWPMSAAELFWFSSFFNRPDWARHQVAMMDRFPDDTHHLALDMVWYDPALVAKASPSPQLDRYFRGAELVSMRGSWTDSNTSFLAFKGGDNHANHAHHQAGAFVFDALGCRWAEQENKEGYDKPGYMDENVGRWNFYRARAEGHNTLVINPGPGPDQEVMAFTSVTRFEPDANSPFAVMDLTPAYAGRADQVQRGFKLIGRKDALIQDEIRAVKPAEVWWFMHTHQTATVSSDGKSAMLAKGDKKVEVRLLSPADGKLALMDAEPLPSSPHPKQTPLGPEKIRKLAIHLTGVTDTRIVVELIPIPDAAAAVVPSARVLPLSQW